MSIFTFIYTYIRTNVRMYVRTYVRMCIYIYTYMHIHAHIDDHFSMARRDYQQTKRHTHSECKHPQEVCPVVAYMSNAGG